MQWYIWPCVPTVGLLLNAEVCSSDIRTGKVKSVAQQTAYFWMVLQPYISIDDFGMALLTSEQRKQFEKLASDAPQVVKVLAENLDMEREMTDNLPESIYQTIYFQTVTQFYMLPIFMDNFLAIAPSQLPRIINQEWMEKPLFYEEFTLLTFNPPKTYSVDEIMDMFDEQMQIIPLYHKVCSNATSFGHSCSSLQQSWFWSDVQNQCGYRRKRMVSSVTVTIYESLEMMYGDVNQDVELNSKTGYFKHKRKPRYLPISFKWGHEWRTTCIFW